MMRLTMHQRAVLTRARAGAKKAKPNPGLPAWPIAVGAGAAALSIPLTAGLGLVPSITLTGAYTLLYLNSQLGYYLSGQAISTVRTVGLFIHPIPLAAAGVAYLGSRRYTQDTSMRVLGTVVGYGAGILLYKPFYQKATVQADVQWCRDHAFLAQFSPTCSAPEVLEILPQAEQDKKWCQDTYVLPWITPACYGQ